MDEWIDLYALLPGLRGIVVHAVAADDEPRVRQVLTEAGFDVRVFEGARMVDEASFFEQVARVFELPDWFGDNWAAFADSLSELHGRIAVLWRDADQTFVRDPQVLLTALQEFAAAADQRVLEEDRADFYLDVFVFGAGPGFPTLES